MKHIRILVLFGVLAAVWVVRWTDPLGHSNAAPTAPLVTPPSRDDHPETAAGGRTTLTDQTAHWPARKSPAELVEPGNAFKTSVSDTSTATLPTFTPVFNPPTAPQVLAAPAPAPTPELPFRVIGTWGLAPDMGVFVATHNETFLARQGEALLTAYQVETITEEQLIVVESSNGKRWTLPLPRPTANSQAPSVNQ